jgi:hypothetical protein
MGALKIKEERGKDGDVLKGEKNAMTAINMVSVLIFCSIKTTHAQTVPRTLQST